MANHVMWLLDVPIAFAHGVFKKSPPANDPSGKARYGASFIMPPKHKSLIEAQEVEKRLVLETPWKDKSSGEEMLAKLIKKDFMAVKDGNDKKKFEGFAGNFFIAANADTRPTAVNRDRSPIVEEDGIIYSGCRVNAKIEIWTMDNGFGQRVNTSLLGVQFVADGDRFSSGSSPATPDDFPDLDAEGGEDDSMFG